MVVWQRGGNWPVLLVMPVFWVLVVMSGLVLSKVLVWGVERLWFRRLIYATSAPAQRTKPGSNEPVASSGTRSTAERSSAKYPRCWRDSDTDRNGRPRPATEGSTSYSKMARSSTARRIDTGSPRQSCATCTVRSNVVMRGARSSCHRSASLAASVSSSGGSQSTSGTFDLMSAKLLNSIKDAGSRMRAILSDPDLVTEVRDVVAALVDGKIAFTPFGSGRSRGFSFKGVGDYGSLIGTAATALTGSVPDGIRRLVEAGISRAYQDRLTTPTPRGQVLGW
jgi:hypothetical protein